MKSKRTKRRLKKNIARVLTLLILAAAIAGLIYLFRKPAVTLAENRRFPVGEKVSLYDLVLEVRDGTLKNEDTVFYSQKAGTR